MLLHLVSPELGWGKEMVLGTRSLDLVVGFHESLLGTWILSSASSLGFAPLCEVGGKSFVSLKLRKPLWKQRPQNKQRQGWFYGALEFLTPLGSECDFSALK